MILRLDRRIVRRKLMLQRGGPQVGRGQLLLDRIELGLYLPQLAFQGERSARAGRPPVTVTLWKVSPVGDRK